MRIVCRAGNARRALWWIIEVGIVSGRWRAGVMTRPRPPQINNYRDGSEGDATGRDALSSTLAPGSNSLNKIWGAVQIADLRRVEGWVRWGDLHRVTADCFAIRVQIWQGVKNVTVTWYNPHNTLFFFTRGGTKTVRDSSVKKKTILNIFRYTCASGNSALFYLWLREGIKWIFFCFCFVNCREHNFCWGELVKL